MNIELFFGQLRCGLFYLSADQNATATCQNPRLAPADQIRVAPSSQGNTELTSILPIHQIFDRFARAAEGPFRHEPTGDRRNSTYSDKRPDSHIKQTEEEHCCTAGNRNKTRYDQDRTTKNTESD